MVITNKVRHTSAILTKLLSNGQDINHHYRIITLQSFYGHARQIGQIWHDWWATLNKTILAHNTPQLNYPKNCQWLLSLQCPIHISIPINCLLMPYRAWLIRHQHDG